MTRGAKEASAKACCSRVESRITTAWEGPNDIADFRGFWYPELLDRLMEDETPELREKVRGKLTNILETHKVEPLGQEVADHLERLVS